METLPLEICSKIFYYVGNTSPYIDELKKAVLNISGCNSEKCYSIYNKKENYYYGNYSCFSDSNDDYYSYYIFIANEIYFVSISIYTDNGNFNYNKTMNISQALLYKITGKCCLEIDERFIDIIINKLMFNVFNIKKIM